ncbi:hypothetical protein BCA37_17220 [Mycobacterium sp. djl-10]|nr:hypothetical protein BCA37_17220 [Mycobacterium sp. djl-10]
MHWDKNPVKADHRDYVKWSVKPYTQGMEVEAGEKCDRLLGLKYHFQYYVICIEFKDATNRKWLRNLTTGKYEGRLYRIRQSIASRRYDTSIVRPFIPVGGGHDVPLALTDELSPPDPGTGQPPNADEVR